jgi:adenosine/AMP kinase
MDIKLVTMKKDNDVQIIIGHAGFIKTVEDLYESIVCSVPNISFGLAFVEASGPCLIRSEGNNAKLRKMCEYNALAINAGHTFIMMFKNAFPINVNNAVKAVPEVVRVYCSTANNVQVVIVETGQGRGILGVIDGSSGTKIETKKDKIKRMKLLRNLGYKL